MRGDISGSDDDEYADDCLVVRCAVYSRRNKPTFQGCSLSPLSEEAASISETSVSSYQTTRRSIPEDSRLHFRDVKGRRNTLLTKLILSGKIKI
jgi:hypothetical protein